MAESIAGKKERTFTWTLDDPRNAWLRLFLFAVALAGLGFVQSAHATSKYEYERATIHCKSKKLYRGEALEIDITGPHLGYYLGVWSSPEQRFRLISFLPEPHDKVAPLIPPNQFAKMTKMRLVGGVTLGSPLDPMANLGPDSFGPPEVIFTKTGLYQVELGELLGTEDGDFDACWVHYYDYPRPKPGEPVPKQTPQPE